MAKALVVGGGVIGLLTARLLGEQGYQVELVERGSLACEASWAGGGIVSPLYPWRYSEAVGALAGWSQGYYPALGDKLRRGTGIDPEVRCTGLYWLDLEDEDKALDWAAALGKEMLRVDRQKVMSRIPVLGGRFARALYMPDLANVRNPRLLQALQGALQVDHNISLVSGMSVDRLLVERGRVVGAKTSSGTVTADCVVLAAGAWSGELLQTLGLNLPVEPVKGQMILYKQEPDFLSAMVLAKGRYAIPRKDGHILVGSTLEHVGFDKTPTDEALASLKASAEELLPGLADAPIVGHWAGLRPGSPEGVPFIGEVPEYPGLWLNCGHYRNGLVLAPASCELLKNLMLGEEPIVDPTPYSPAGRLGWRPIA
ncbi:glycine oxidase ThiO [Pseudomonas sp. BMS12]|uniref:glycine oxidase ThiO n=1 Tax=Pseudomonas sp. BMS12 TaxID=1796033 RepID=UPI00083B3B2A|nr:glycine oxidase ThiO [Pseudomonas sp. BMS12]